jgi:predicted DNA-binding transcriptional regulator AlpA
MNEQMTTDFDNFPEELTDMAGAMLITSLSDKTIYRYEKEGRFPQRVKIGRRTAYVKRELHAWVREIASKRPGVQR